MTMRSKIQRWLGLEDIQDSLSNMNSLSFLRPDEIQVYRAPLKFMHDASRHVGEHIEINHPQKFVKGVCVGYGTFINNVQRDKAICSTIRKFYVVQLEDGREELVTLEEDMKVYVNDLKV